MALTRLFDGNTENWTATGGTATVIYTGPWSSRKADNVIGSSHPDLTISDLLVATSVTIEPFGNASDAGGPTTAKHTVTYESTSSSVDSVPADSVLSDWMEQWEAGGEAVTLGGGFRWSDLTPVVWIEGTEDSPVKLFPTATIGISGNTNKFTTGAKTKVLNCVGKLNASAMTIKGHSYAAQHLLFLGLNANQTGKVHQLSYKIAYRHDNTWNEFWRKKDPNGNHVGFHRLIDESGKEPYTTTGFSDLDPKNW